MRKPALASILEGISIPVAYKLGYITNFYREPSFRLIEAEFGLTRPEILTLIFLDYQDAIAVSDICAFSGHLVPNISRAAIALDGKGLVRRGPDPKDQRRQILFLTPAGRALHDRFIPMLRAREAEMLSCLSERERTQFERLTRKLAAHVPAWATLPEDALKSSEDDIADAA